MALHLSDRRLNRILATPAGSDADEVVHAMAREIQTLRGEVAQLRQTFVPIFSNVDPRTREFFLAFNDLCQAHKVAAAAVVPYGTPGGELLLHIGGEQRSATLVQALMPKAEGT